MRVCVNTLVGKKINFFAVVLILDNFKYNVLKREGIKTTNTVYNILFLYLLFL